MLYTNLKYLLYSSTLFSLVLKIGLELILDYFKLALLLEVVLNSCISF
jgi:hypothetical protein